MHMHKRCPKCAKMTVAYDRYFKRDRCRNRECGWMAKITSHEKETRAKRKLAYTYM